MFPGDWESEVSRDIIRPWGDVGLRYERHVSTSRDVESLPKSCRIST
jgi:hypothetical protein